MMMMITLSKLSLSLSPLGVTIHRPLSKCLNDVRGEYFQTINIFPVLFCLLTFNINKVNKISPYNFTVYF